MKTQWKEKWQLVRSESVWIGARTPDLVLVAHGCLLNRETHKRELRSLFDRLASFKAKMHLQGGVE
jgi:hypothetical protein